MKNPRRRISALALIAASSMALASCMTATPYQPATGSGSYRTGYWDERIEDNRFRVTFAGNSVTSRETVERYLLYRSAELTVQNGFDYFVLSDRDTEKRTDFYTTPSYGYGADPFWGWSPYWRYYRPAYGWRGWSPYWGDPFFDRQVDIRTVERYEALAEIVTGRGQKPQDNVRAFDARDVLNRLGPQVKLPATGR